MNKNAGKLILLSVLLWLASLPCEVFPGIIGIYALVFGPLVCRIVDGTGCFAVYAHPVYALLLSQVWLGHGSKALRVSLPAAMWGLAWLTFTVDEKAYGIGLYLWFAALAVATAAAISAWHQTESRPFEQGVCRIRQ